MNSNTPPIPQPSGATCPNCGAAQNSNAAYCSNCGAFLGGEAPRLLHIFVKVVFSFTLALIALAFGVLAACLPVLEGIGSGSPNHTTSPEILLLMGVALLLAGACIWGIFRINRK